MSRKIKEVGHVVDLPAGGHVAIALRYGTGRKLDAPRIIADGRYPFATRAQAVEYLGRFKADPRSVRTCALDELLPLPEAKLVTERHVAPPVARVRRTTMTRPAPLPAPDLRVVTASRPRPVVAHCDLSGVTITKCPEMVRRNLDPRKGGVMPAHLNPVTLS